MMKAKWTGYHEGHKSGDTRKKQFRDQNKYAKYRTNEDQGALDQEAKRIEALEKENKRLKKDHEKYKKIIGQIESLGGMVNSLKDRSRKTSKIDKSEPKAYGRGLRREKKRDSSKQDKKKDIAYKKVRRNKEKDHWQ